ncbi:MAG: DeoR/GlpR family DNA-binding transcription regulator [Defluviitaleaceae bacterium]|nr:DeoR/GlpR family DNA-binding transcription regulator [Defluviitaleaceae bacterium]
MANKSQRRREKILVLLSQVPISSTQQLAAATGVSAETMRKDLDALSEGGQIIKVHGGVALANTVSAIPFDLRAQKNAELKMKIAGAAAGLVAQGDAILMESCTTSLELAKVLAQDQNLLQTLIVFTNSLAIASLFSNGAKCKKLFFLGGWVNLEEHASQGYQTTEMMRKVHVDKAFLSGAAINNDLVVTGYYDDDVAFQQTALKCAGETVLMVDSSKFENTAVLTVSHLSQMKFLVTDKMLSNELNRHIASLNVIYVHAQ